MTRSEFEELEVRFAHWHEKVFCDEDVPSLQEFLCLNNDDFLDFIRGIYTE